MRLKRELMENKKDDSDQVVILLQDMLEVVTRDIMDEQFADLLDSGHGGSYGRYEGMTLKDKKDQLFAPAGAINFPLEESDAWAEKIKRLYLLLTVKESAMDVPSNLEARRRISFFSNSLFMNMPDPPKVRNMLSFSILTPYYTEDVLFSLHDLEEPNEDGVSILFYLQKIYPDEWTNFLERINCKSEELEEKLKLSEELEEKLKLEEELKEIEELKEKLNLCCLSIAGLQINVIKRGRLSIKKNMGESLILIPMKWRTIHDSGYIFCITCWMSNQKSLDLRTYHKAINN